MLTPKQKKIVEDNHNLIYFYINKNNLDENEYYDLLALSLCKAAKKFDPSKGKFSTFAMHCFKMDHLIEIRDKKAAKRDALVISLSSETCPDSENRRTELYDIIPGDRDVFDKMILLDIPKLLDDRLAHICKLSYLGYDQQEIADMIGFSQSLVSRQLKIAKKILKEEAIYD
jgi:RNA polymerase sporulation-specific sigma factor